MKKKLIRKDRNLSNIARVFQAEAKALASCAKHIHSQEIVGKNINIYSDSQALLKALAKHKVTSKSVYECVKYLKEIGQRNQVNVILVPEHEGRQ